MPRGRPLRLGLPTRSASSSNGAPPLPLPGFGCPTLRRVSTGAPAQPNPSGAARRHHGRAALPCRVRPTQASLWPRWATTPFSDSRLSPTPTPDAPVRNVVLRSSRCCRTRPFDSLTYGDEEALQNNFKSDSAPTVGFIVRDSKAFMCSEGSIRAIEIIIYSSSRTTTNCHVIPDHALSQASPTSFVGRNCMALPVGSVNDLLLLYSMVYPVDLSCCWSCDSEHTKWQCY
ncbi:uncharacterized protein [Miscanthus floridulus]|uniref:uncharacterized protein isoform X2 n=1 Tax=Miscanthus floridulus TaxID=154761 RepID=UPI00345897C2